MHESYDISGGINLVARGVVTVVVGSEVALNSSCRLRSDAFDEGEFKGRAGGERRE